MVPRRSPIPLGRIVERMAALLAPRHRDLAQAMISELDAIDDPAERRRFAAGAIAAILRLSLCRFTAVAIQTPDGLVGHPAPADDTHLGVPSMPTLSARQILRNHVTPLAVAFTVLTSLLVVNAAARQIPRLSARGESVGTMLEVVLLTIPSVIALTMPMAVLLAVSWVFVRLGKEGVLAAARRERHGIRRLLGPVLGAAALISALTFVSNDQILPRSNARLMEILAGAPRQPTDRSMTISELREASRRALAEAGPNSAARAAELEVEIHKKFALAASCLILALAGAAIAIRFPRGGIWLVISTSGIVFLGYYAALIAGESLADQRVISPFIAMWMANAVVLAAVALLVWPGGRASAPPKGTLAIGG